MGENMKTSEVFIADLYKTQNYRSRKQYYGVSFVGEYVYETKLVRRNVIVIKMGNSYVIAEEIPNLIKLLTLKFQALRYGFVVDKNITLINDESVANTADIYFLDNARQIDSFYETVSLKQLKFTQEQFDNSKKYANSQYQYSNAQSQYDNARRY